MQILIAEPSGYSPRALRVLRGLGKVRLEAVAAGGLAAAVGDSDVLWLRLGHRIDREVLRRAPRLRWVVCPATGTDHLDLEACEARGIRVLCLRGERAFLDTVRGTAEMTLGLTLALLRRIPEAVEHARSAPTWERERFIGGELSGRRVGIVGVGRLGTMCAKLFRAFKAKVAGFDADAACRFPRGLKRFGRLEDLLAWSDIVSLHVDLHPGSAGMVDGAFLDALRPGSVLINTSRGQVVQTDALLAALRSGHLAGAALDVLDGEQDAEHPRAFRAAQAFAVEHPGRLLLTPHIGGATRESMPRAEEFLARRLRQEMTGSCLRE